jgi:uncharacterized damage-inducible protein DinB
MMYYGANELAASFKQVRGNTIRIAEEVPEERYDFRASPDTRSIGEMLTHIALGAGFQSHVHMNRIDDLRKVNFGELVAAMKAEEAKSRSKAEILDLLGRERDRFAAFLVSLPESFLAEPVQMPPGSQPATKSRLEMLLSVKEHEMHHRGQLMLMQRMIGLVPHITRQRLQQMAQRQSA